MWELCEELLIELGEMELVPFSLEKNLGGSFLPSEPIGLHNIHNNELFVQFHPSNNLLLFGNDNIAGGDHVELP